MKRLQAEDKLKSRIRDISAFYHQNSRMPSFSEIGKIFKLSSKSSVHKVVGKLVAVGVVSKDIKGRLIPGSIKEPVRMLGTVEAGFPSPAEEELSDTISLDDLLIKNREATFLLKVSGDSMSGAGILARGHGDRGQRTDPKERGHRYCRGRWSMDHEVSEKARGKCDPTACQSQISANQAEGGAQDCGCGDSGGQEV